MMVRVISVVLLCALVVSGVAAESSTNVCTVLSNFSLERYLQTETNSACVTPDAVAAARDACAGMTAGQVCLGAGDVQASPQDSLAVVGTAVALDGIDTLTGSVGSLALVQMQADLPADAAPVQLALFGDASIANAISGLQEPFPTVTVKNGPSNILNLRSAPDADAEVVTTMRWNEELTADGRSSAGDWLRVQTEQGVAWVFASLVAVTDGDVGALYVLDSPVTQHLQSLTLTTGASCSGLLIESSNAAPAHLQVNGALLTISAGVLLLRAPEGGTLDIQVLSGGVGVSASGASVEAEAGTAVSVGDAAPEVLDSFPFASVAGAPLDALASSACIAGVSSGSVALFTEPGGASAGELASESSAVVTGQATVDGVPWWQLGASWVAQSDVQTAGVCAAVPEVSPVAQQSVSQPQVSVANNMLPSGRSIWTAHTGPDNLTGTCTLPPIAQCDHLAAITPNPDGTMTWLGQEPVPYTLYPAGENTYTGSIYANGAHLSVTVTVTSPTTWIGSKTTVYDSDPGCTHTFSYTAELR